MNLKSVLRESVTKSSLGKSKEEIEKENLKIECELFKKYYSDPYETEISTCKSKTIPRFFFKIPSDQEKLGVKFREESRSMFLQRRSRELLDSNELKSLWILLDKHHSPPYYAEEQLITYRDFLKVSTLAGIFNIIF